MREEALIDSDCELCQTTFHGWVEVMHSGAYQALHAANMIRGASKGSYDVTVFDAEGNVHEATITGGLDFPEAVFHFFEIQHQHPTLRVTIGYDSSTPIGA